MDCLHGPGRVDTDTNDQSKVPVPGTDSDEGEPLKESDMEGLGF